MAIPVAIGSRRPMATLTTDLEQKLHAIAVRAPDELAAFHVLADFVLTRLRAQAEPDYPARRQH